MPLRGDPFHRLTICGVFQRASEVFTAEPIKFVSIGAIGAIPSFFMNWLILAKFSVLFKFDEMTDPDEFNKNILDTVMSLIGPLLVVFTLVTVFSIVLKVATIRSTIRIYVGKQPELAQDLRRGVSLLARMFCLQCAFMCGMMTMGLVVGLVIGIVTMLASAMLGENAGVFIALIFNMCFQVALTYFTYTLILWDTALVVEDLSQFHPFVRSYELVKEQCCFVFWAVFLEGTAMMILFGLNFLLFSGFGTHFVALAQAVTGVVVMPYAGIFLTVLYVNARITREECNSTILSHQMMLDGEAGASYNVLQYPETSAIKIDLGAYTDDSEKKEVAIQMI